MRVWSFQRVYCGVAFNIERICFDLLVSIIFLPVIWIKGFHIKFFINCKVSFFFNNNEFVFIYIHINRENKKNNYNEENQHKNYFIFN